MKFYKLLPVVISFSGRFTAIFRRYFTINASPYLSILMAPALHQRDTFPLHVVFWTTLGYSQKVDGHPN